MSISPGSEASELQRLTCLRYYNVQQWENKFTLGLDAAKINNYIEKGFKHKLLRIKFPTKNSAGARVYFPQEWSLGFQILTFLSYYYNAVQ